MIKRQFAKGGRGDFVIIDNFKRPSSMNCPGRSCRGRSWIDEPDIATPARADPARETMASPLPASIRPPGEGPGVRGIPRDFENQQPGNCHLSRRDPCLPATCQSPVASPSTPPSPTPRCSYPTRCGTRPPPGRYDPAVSRTPGSGCGAAGGTFRGRPRTR